LTRRSRPSRLLGRELQDRFNRGSSRDVDQFIDGLVIVR
jgi:hypothetical protein